MSSRDAHVFQTKLIRQYIAGIFTQDTSDSLECDFSTFDNYIKSLMTPSMSMNNIRENWTISYINKSALNTYYKNFFPAPKKHKYARGQVPSRIAGTSIDPIIIDSILPPKKRFLAALEEKSAKIRKV